MQRANGGGVATRTEPRRAVSPIAAGLMVLVLVGTALAYLALNRADETSPPPVASGAPEPELLTEAEAIAEFKRLHALTLEIAESVNAELIPMTFTASGPMSDRVKDELAQLQRDGITDHTVVSFRQIKVLSSKTDELRIETVSVVTPCFINSKEHDVTKSRLRYRQFVIWELRRQDDRWLIDEASLQQQTTLERRRQSCA